MGRKLLLGKAGSDYGLFVSKTEIVGNVSVTTDVVNDSGVLTSGDNLLFDSRVGIGSLPLKFHGQGTISAPATVGTAATTTITHGLNYKPFVIVQWCFSTDVTSGVATKMYPAMYYSFFEDDFNSDYGIQEEEYESRFYGGVSFQVTTTTVIIKNHFSGGRKDYIITGQGASQEYEDISPLEIKYAFLIFDVEGVNTT
jgi:hypothetical protein